MPELGLDMEGRCSIAWLYISAAGSDILVRGRDGNLDIQRENYGELGVDSDMTKYGNLDKWGRHSSGRRDGIVGDRLGETLVEAWSGLGDVTSF